jgi:hypothetical protein
MLMMEKLVRRTHMTMVAVVALLVGLALASVISLRVSEGPGTAIPPTLTPAAAVVPAQGVVAPLEPAPVAAPTPPKPHAPTPTIRKHTPSVGGNEDWTSGQAQREMASRLCGNFGVSC